MCLRRAPEEYIAGAKAPAGWSRHLNSRTTDRRQVYASCCIPRMEMGYLRLAERKLILVGLWYT
jgi:hypothetical protein